MSDAIEDKWKRFDALMRLAEFRQRERARRIQLEWVVSLGIWSVLATADLNASKIPCEVFLVGGIFAVGIQGWWINWNFSRNERDAKWMDRYFGMAVALISAGAGKGWKRRCLCQHWPAVMQFLIAFMLWAGGLLLKLSPLLTSCLPKVVQFN